MKLAVIFWICSALQSIISFSSWDKLRDSTANIQKLEDMEPKCIYNSHYGNGVPAMLTKLYLIQTPSQVDKNGHFPYYLPVAMWPNMDFPLHWPKTP